MIIMVYIIQNEVYQVELNTNDQKDYIILGIENRVEQIIANLLDKLNFFSKDNQEIRLNSKKKKWLYKSKCY